KKYDVVCLINVADPTAAGWKSLADYLNQGGGVAILLGGKVDRLAYRTTEAETVLPAELLATLSFNPPEFLDLQNVTHPMLKMFTFELGATELEAVEIHRYWRVKAFPEASVITRFTDHLRSPALIERGHGKGLSLLFSTGVDRNGWNDLPAVWPFLALADQMMQYLSRAGASQFNYTAGMNVVVNLEDEKPPAKYLLRKPKQQQLPGEIPPGATSLTLRDLDQLGNYRLLDAE